jgi:hypothetical protein
VYYMVYVGVLDQLVRMRDELLIAKEQDYLEERKKVIQDCVDKLNGSIFDLICAIELRKEGTEIEDKNEKI